ncbi:MAG: ribbon-helix-helix domain-containing protein [Candidatus Woesearchaeota archaeon]
MRKKRKEDAEILNIRLPSNIISWIDSQIKNNAYRTRSEAVRELLREFIFSYSKNQEKEDKGDEQ